MTIICTKLGGTDASNGQLADVDDVVETFDVTAAATMIPDQGSSVFIYVGSGWDSGTTTGTNTFAISAAELRNANYIVVEITYNSSASSGNGNTNGASLRVERNETGQSSWSDIMGSKKVTQSSASSGTGDADVSTATIRLYAATTAGEKTNGIDIRVSSIGSVNAGGSATVSNIQTVFRMAN